MFIDTGEVTSDELLVLADYWEEQGNPRAWIPRTMAPTLDNEVRRHFKLFELLTMDEQAIFATHMGFEAANHVRDTLGPIPAEIYSALYNQVKLLRGADDYDSSHKHVQNMQGLSATILSDGSEVSHRVRQYQWEAYRVAIIVRAACDWSRQPIMRCQLASQEMADLLINPKLRSYSRRLKQDYSTLLAHYDEEMCQRVMEVAWQGVGELREAIDVWVDNPVYIRFEELGRWAYTPRDGP